MTKAMRKQPGAEIPHPPWREFVQESLLDWYDRPRLYLRRTRGGQRFLALWNDHDGETDRWLHLPVSRERLKPVMEGQITLREAIIDPGDGWLLVTDEAADGTVSRTVMAWPEDLDPESLPLPGARLGIREG